MRLLWILAATGLLSACSGQVPDSGNTVFLEPVSAEARAQRDVQLQSGKSTSSTTAGSVTLQPVNASGQIIAAPAAASTGMSRAQSAPTATASSYQVVTPKAVPSRPSGSAPSVAGYALETTHAVGTTVYQRNAASEDRSARACARYASDDLAQAAFLQTGGPAEDGQGLDPDGDGFACAWDPERFRQAIK